MATHHPASPWRDRGAQGSRSPTEGRWPHIIRHLPRGTGVHRGADPRRRGDGHTSSGISPAPRGTGVHRGADPRRRGDGHTSSGISPTPRGTGVHRGADPRRRGDGHTSSGISPTPRGTGVHRGADPRRRGDGHTSSGISLAGPGCTGEQIPDGGAMATHHPASPSRDRGAQGSRSPTEGRWPHIIRHLPRGTGVHRGADPRRRGDGHTSSGISLAGPGCTGEQIPDGGAMATHHPASPSRDRGAQGSRSPTEGRWPHIIRHLPRPSRDRGAQGSRSPTEGRWPHIIRHLPHPSRDRGAQRSRSPTEGRWPHIIRHLPHPSRDRGAQGSRSPTEGRWPHIIRHLPRGTGVHRGADPRRRGDGHTSSGISPAPRGTGVHRGADPRRRGDGHTSSGISLAGTGCTGEQIPDGGAMATHHPASPSRARGAQGSRSPTEGRWPHIIWHLPRGPGVHRGADPRRRGDGHTSSGISLAGPGCTGEQIPDGGAMATHHPASPSRDQGAQVSRSPTEGRWPHIIRHLPRWPGVHRGADPRRRGDGHTSSGISPAPRGTGVHRGADPRRRGDGHTSSGISPTPRGTGVHRGADPRRRGNGHTSSGISPTPRGTGVHRGADPRRRGDGHTSSGISLAGPGCTGEQIPDGGAMATHHPASPPPLAGPGCTEEQIPDGGAMATHHPASPSRDRGAQGSRSPTEGRWPHIIRHLPRGTGVHRGADPRRRGDGHTSSGISLAGPGCTGEQIPDGGAMATHHPASPPPLAGPV
ncbi:hypothetical protein NDU88_000534 [Pleurodeles waltl]|uniref:Uncharacterized protein n=1 Tax=Pleurodeles waltl TaxID=8319 RepID=A0AAV7P600_PLEWA|nr:hypothetical protein NDU88_000534 [Pleurodeles waltl]